MPIRELFSPEFFKTMQMVSYAGAFVATVVGGIWLKRGHDRSDKKMTSIVHEVTETENGSLKGAVRRCESEIGNLREDMRSLDDRVSGVDDRLASIERNVATIMEVVLTGRPR